jgi:predicted DNA-binding transcriptional regulator AlpA
VVKIGKSVRIPRAALERWVAERTVEAEAALARSA